MGGRDVPWGGVHHLADWVSMLLEVYGRCIGEDKRCGVLRWIRTWNRENGAE